MAREKKIITKEEKDRRLSVAAAIIKTLLFALVIGFVLTLATLLVPVTVESAEAVDDMRFGMPFAYLKQSFSGIPNSEFFPCKVIPKFTERYSTEIDVWMFLASFAVNSVIATGVTFLVKKQKCRCKAKNEAEAEPEIEIKDSFAVTEDKKESV